MSHARRGLLPRVFCLLLCTSACGGRPASAPTAVGDAERLRATLNGKAAQSLAPSVFATADQELKLAKEAESAGDTVGAELHGEHALATYDKAIALARVARAAEEDAAASEARGRAAQQAQQYGAQRGTVDREVDDLEKKLRVAREAQLPPSSGAADAERERARIAAAQSLVTQARLLCGAARLVSPQAPGLADAGAAVVALEKPAAGTKAATTIDAAARARAGCLATLTKARRSAGPGTDQADTLLGELSQSVDPKAARGGTDLAPSRDERGIVVTLRSVFQGDGLSPEAEERVKVLGRVAAAHPSFAVQIVLHDASPPGASEALSNQKRGEALQRALSEGGLATSKSDVEQAGAKAPVVDPRDLRHRDRNARVEIVFVSPGT